MNAGLCPASPVSACLAHEGGRPLGVPHRRDQGLQAWCGFLLSAVAWAVAGLIAVALVAPPVSGGLIADWQFEGNVDDATGSYNATALNSPTYATGVIGQAFQPDRGTTALNMGNTYTTVTVSAWIQTYDANSPGNQAIFHNDRWDTGTPHFLLSYASGSPSTATTGLVLGVLSSGTVALNGALSTINENTWHHVAYTYDTPSSRLRLYIDGTEAGNVAISSVNLDLNTMVIGSGFNRHFNGLIDDLGVWNETLSATEVLGISNFATSSLNYGQGDVAPLYGLGVGQSTTTSDGATWAYATGLTGTEGTVESLGSGLYAMNLGGGTGVQMTAVALVPEPSTIALLAAAGVGVAGAAAHRRRARAGCRSHRP